MSFGGGFSKFATYFRLAPLAVFGASTDLCLFFQALASLKQLQPLAPPLHRCLEQILHRLLADR